MFLNLNKQDEAGEMMETLQQWQAEVAATAALKKETKKWKKERKGEINTQVLQMADKLSEFLSVKELTTLSDATGKMTKDDDLGACLDDMIALIAGSTTSAPSGDMQMVEFEVPEGSLPGSTVRINVGGQDVDVVIPENVKPGQKMMIQVPVPAAVGTTGEL